MAKRLFKHDTIALVYDFDGTLSPQPMQEYTFLPKIGIEPKDFWDKVKKEAKEYKEEAMLVYMRLLLEESDRKQVHVEKNDLKKMAHKIEYFKGVESWFDRINQYVRDKGDGHTKIRHYIISAGLKEILEGVSIKKHFHNIFASEYHFNHHKMATFPKVLITDTSKTQYLFRINKGREDLAETINDHMPVPERPIPFSNIIYVGDGLTDVPSMTVTKANGGNALAVYKEKGDKHAKSICKTLLKEGRVNFIAPADYSENSLLEKRVHLLLKSVIANIEYQRELFNCRREHDI